jgi:hypothetical protein
LLLKEEDSRFGEDCENIHRLLSLWVCCE